MVEEIEVEVRDTAGATKAANAPLFEGLRRIMLASIGAVALSRDEAENFIDKLVARGEIAQKDGERLVGEMRTRMNPSAQVEQASVKVESGIEQLLNRLNIPSKRDIDDLTVKIAQLTARVNELRKQP